jgi:hypothetical protein
MKEVMHRVTKTPIAVRTEAFRVCDHIIIRMTRPSLFVDVAAVGDGLDLKVVAALGVAGAEIGAHVQG